MCRCLCYECLQVPWPVSIVVSSRCMDIYNEAFRFLLQIKRVKYSLERLKFLGILIFCAVINHRSAQM